MTAVPLGPGQFFAFTVLAVCGLLGAVEAARRRDATLLLLAAAFALLAVLSGTGGRFDLIISQGKPVPRPLALLQWSVACGFFIIGTVSVIDWFRNRGRPQAMLAGSVGLLGVLAVCDQTWARDTTAPLPPAVDLTLLLVSGVCFFLFRAAVVPARASTVRVVAGLVLLSVVLVAASSLPSGRESAPGYTAVQLVVIVMAIGVWGFSVGEPCVRLWMHSRSLPVVQRMRARFLAAGYGGIVAVLLVAVPLALAFKQLQGTPGFAYGLEIMILASQPLMLFALFPPPWLRRFWRETEEERFRLATHELLLGTPDARALAAQCLEWAVRLVGAEAGCIIGLDGEMLATSNLSHEQALMLAGASHQQGGRQALRLSPGEPHSNVIIVPMHSALGTGAISVVSGRFTPLLGSDEVNRLTQYAASVTAAFDRLILLDRLTESRAAAEMASRRKSEHLSRMSHELRTPMSAILGFAELLSLKDPREDQIPSINHVIKAADHLLALINEVLQIALIESGGGEVSLEAVDLNTAITESIGLVDRQAAVGEITLNRDLHGEASRVIADNRRLRQVLVNLLANAVKYNRPGGAVTVRTAAREGTVRIEVVDTGAGIPPAAADGVFEPFDRGGKERSGIEGTGLGLALARALIAAMHGSIGYESEEGVGTTFWVELPRAEPAAEAVAPGGDAPATAAHRRGSAVRDVLFVDDNLVNIELVDRILSQERPGLHLVPASTGAAALTYLEQHRPALILLDLHLGDIDGDEVLRRIRADRRLGELPVVMLSADAGPAQIDRLMALGANEYMTKPFRVTSLLRVIDSGIAGTLKSTRTEGHSDGR